MLPEGFVKFVSTPAPAWRRKEYGGQFWVNGEGQWTLPRSAYFMSGAGGQHTFIVPSHDLVVVRMGHQRGAPVGTKLLNQSLAALSLPSRRRADGGGANRKGASDDSCSRSVSRSSLPPRLAAAQCAPKGDRALLATGTGVVRRHRRQGVATPSPFTGGRSCTTRPARWRRS
jgi:hypothetical protein